MSEREPDKAVQNYPKAIEFIKSIVDINGPYPYVNNTEMVRDVYILLKDLGE